MTVVQKLLTPTGTSRIVDEGYAGVGGYVADARDIGALNASELVAANGWEAILGDEPEYVDVLRFETNAMMTFSKPSTAEVPWPSYPSGFLKGTSLAPVWELARTRVPIGTEFWRIRADGEQRMLSVYGGLDRGWANAKGYAPPTELIGPRAEWRGVEFPAALIPGTNNISLLSLGAPPTTGQFVESMPGIHTSQVPLAECDSVFEIIVTARWMGTRVRFLSRVGDEARVQILEPDAYSIQRLNATEVEPGVFEAVVPTAELTDTQGVRNEMRG
ncbi:hypothetical protein ACFVDI_16260 [Nocardioides sp. NPDC057767]|uniref:hypothetical protein n=1 Tax=unclassified Nocardioides TaxID=2615069 RepID=UPI003670EE45